MYILSTMLFNLYEEYIMKKTLDGKHYEDVWKRVVTGGCKWTNLRYVCDTTLFAVNVEIIKILLEGWLRIWFGD